MCGVVILGGAFVVLLTWTRTDVAAAELSVGVVVLSGWVALILIALGSGALLAPRLTTHSIVLVVALTGLLAVLLAGLLWREQVIIRLPAFWMIQLLAVALAGFMLSGQVDKVWVRTFSLVGLAILGALLITIGRNERVNIATRAAETAYLQLAQIQHDRTREADNPPSPASIALVGELCTLAGRDDCEQEKVEQGTDLDSCLSGWTYQAFEEWADDASIDREVAATAALARCELQAFEPGSISETGEQGEAAPSEVVLTEGPDLPADPDAADELVAAEAQAQAAIDARVAVAEAISTQRSEANLIETLGDGADGILSSISGPNEFAEFRFSGATWLVLMALTLFWYRQLEIRAGSHGLGPIEIIYEDEPPTGKSDDSGSSPADGHVGGLQTGQAIFKQAVVQNVPEPGAVPGAQALAPVGDLISSTEAPNKWVATGFVDAVRTILATRSGYTVLYSAHQEPSPTRQTDNTANGTFVVFVRLRDTQNGAQQASMRFESEYLAEAAQMAGYWVAGWIISRSRYVPEWAVWSERDAHAFYSLQWRQGDDLPLQAHGIVDPDRIQASTNALILAQRAYAFQISPKSQNQRPRASSLDPARPYTFNALEDFARAAYHQPRYPVARYRRAVALSSLMHKGVKLHKAFMPRHTDDAQEPLLPSKPRLVHLFRDLIGYGRENEVDEKRLIAWIEGMGPDGQFPEEMRRTMLTLSYSWLLQSERSVSAGLVAQLRPSERRFWHEFGRTGTRRDWITLVRVSQQIVKLRLKDAGLDCRVDENELPKERAGQADSHWQISYNMGCYYALRAEQAQRPGNSEQPGDFRRRAFDWLECCLDRPFSGQLVREWIDRDPDLHALRDVNTTEDDGLSWQRWRLRVPLMPVQIRQGDRSSAVKRLQEQLNLLSSSTTGDLAVTRLQGNLKPLSRSPSGSAVTPLDADGYFGTKTRAAVEDFQYHHDLRVSGNPDLTMLALLETLSEAKVMNYPPAPEQTGSAK